MDSTTSVPQPQKGSFALYLLLIVIRGVLLGVAIWGSGVLALRCWDAYTKLP